MRQLDEVIHLRFTKKFTMHKCPRILSHLRFAYSQDKNKATWDTTKEKKVIVLALVVQKWGSVIHEINHYPADRH